MKLQWAVAVMALLLAGCQTPTSSSASDDAPPPLRLAREKCRAILAQQHLSSNDPTDTPEHAWRMIDCVQRELGNAPTRPPVQQAEPAPSLPEPERPLYDFTEQVRPYLRRDAPPATAMPTRPPTANQGGVIDFTGKGNATMPAPPPQARPSLPAPGAMPPQGTGGLNEFSVEPAQ